MAHPIRKIDRSLRQRGQTKLADEFLRVVGRKVMADLTPEEVRDDIVDEVISMIKDGDFDNRDAFFTWIHETVDGSSTVIYTAKARDYVNWSPNEGYGVKEGLIGPEDFDSGIPWEKLAYCALEQDVMEELIRRGVDINSESTFTDPEDLDLD